MKETFVTITGVNYYMGLKPFKVGRVVKLIKEKDNDYDTEAVRVDMPYLDTVGYVANSVGTVYEGTSSAGRIYDNIEDITFAQVIFVTHSAAIARLITKDELAATLTSEKDFFTDSKAVVPAHSESEIISF